jgi:hypothetical protein
MGIGCYSMRKVVVRVFVAAALEKSLHAYWLLQLAKNRCTRAWENNNIILVREDEAQSHFAVAIK